MFKQMMVLAAFIAAAVIGNSAVADTLTGCLKANGSLVKFAIGDAPSDPCRGNQTQVTLQAGGNGNGGGQLQSFAVDRSHRQRQERVLAVFLGVDAIVAQRFDAFDGSRDFVQILQRDTCGDFHSGYTG